MGDGPPGIEQANALAEAQLTIQATFFANLDAQAVGFLGVSIALAALDITLRDVIGKFWWFPFVGFVVAAVLSVLAIIRLRAQTGPHLPEKTPSSLHSRRTTRPGRQSQEIRMSWDTNGGLCFGLPSCFWQVR